MEPLLKIYKPSYYDTARFESHHTKGYGICQQRPIYTLVLHLFPQQKLTNRKHVNSWVTISSTVCSHNTESVVHIVLSSNIDSGGCDNSSRELGGG